METHRSLRDIIVDMRACARAETNVIGRARRRITMRNRQPRQPLPAGLAREIREPANTTRDAIVRARVRKDRLSHAPSPLHPPHPTPPHPTPSSRCTYARTCMGNSSSITVPRRQEIIKRYPEWRKYYRRISETPRVVDDGGERRFREKERERGRMLPITVRSAIRRRWSLTGGPRWAITPSFVT